MRKLKEKRRDAIGYKEVVFLTSRTFILMTCISFALIMMKERSEVSFEEFRRFEIRGRSMLTSVQRGRWETRLVYAE